MSTRQASSLSTSRTAPRSPRVCLFQVDQSTVQAAERMQVAAAFDPPGFSPAAPLDRFEAGDR
jgi:hypothetical protein